MSGARSVSILDSDGLTVVDASTGSEVREAFEALLASSRMLAAAELAFLKILDGLSADSGSAISSHDPGELARGTSGVAADCAATLGRA